jgi:D-glycero-alpha-D-manno-heptose-7-phosphate kinase
MLVTRTPLRVSLFGGGTDLPSYFHLHSGGVVSFAISKYIYISINKLSESDDILIKYSKLERVQNVEEIQHKIIRAILKRYKVTGVDIAITSDIPAGTGLGSSSAFTVGMLKTITEFKGIELSKSELASLACEIELKDLGEPIGKQDQYSAAFGGINNFVFNQDDSVDVGTLRNPEHLKNILAENSIMIRVGDVRKASSLLKKQNDDTLNGFNTGALKSIDSLRKEFLLLERFTSVQIGNMLLDSWSAKKTLSSEISSSEIDEMLVSALDSGATGGKLLGAGGSGYLLVVFESESKLKFFREALPPHVSYITPVIDYDGSIVVYRSE